MTTYETVEAARAAGCEDGVVAICEIDHIEAGRCYVRTRCSMQVLARSIETQPIPEIVRLVAEHPVKTPDRLAAEREQSLPDDTRCERCRAKIDGTKAYRQQEWTRFGGRPVRVTAYYCEDCRKLLQAIGAGEATEMQARSADVPSAEQAEKGEDE